MRTGSYKEQEFTAFRAGRWPEPLPATAAPLQCGRHSPRRAAARDANRRSAARINGVEVEEILARDVAGHPHREGSHRLEGLRPRHRDGARGHLMPDLPFHPLVARWFSRAFPGPTDVQVRGWEEIAAGRDTLISAPTGSGKTLAAFMSAVSGLFERAAAGTLADHIHVVYVSPLKALGNDIEKNLRDPLDGIGKLAADDGIEPAPIRVGVRTGRYARLPAPATDQETAPHPDHDARIALHPAHRRAQSRRAGERPRRSFSTRSTRSRPTSAAATSRLSVERLDRLVGGGLQRIGLSATQKPIEAVARLLVGTARIDPRRQATLLDRRRRPPSRDRPVDRAARFRARTDSVARDA